MTPSDLVVAVLMFLSPISGGGTGFVYEAEKTVTIEQCLEEAALINNDGDTYFLFCAPILESAGEPA